MPTCSVLPCSPTYYELVFIVKSHVEKVIGYEFKIL